MPTFLDTNVLVYAFDTDEAKKQAVALRLLSSASDQWVISAQVLGEFYVTVTRKLRAPLSPLEARDRVRDLTGLGVVPITAALVETATEISRESAISYWDASIIAAAAGAGCDRVLSEDLQSGQVIGGVELHDPFREATERT